MAHVASLNSVRGFVKSSATVAAPVPRVRPVCRASMTGSNIVPWPDDMNRDAVRRDGTPQPVFTEADMQNDAQAMQEGMQSAKRRRTSSKKQVKKAIIATMPYSHARYFGWMSIPK